MSYHRDMFSLRSASGYPRRVRAGLGLCFLLSCGVGGCAGASPEGAASPPGSAQDLPRGLAAAEPSPPRLDEGEPADASEGRAPRAHTNNPWADCYQAFRPSDDPAIDLARLTAACGARAGMVAVTPIHMGAQGEESPSERLSFRAHAGRCYRAFAVAAPSVLDLDIAITDARSSLLAGDISQDRWPVVPPRGPLCAPKSERYTVEISVASGRGQYLFQLWGSPEEEDDDEDAARGGHRSPERVADGRAD